MFQIQLYFKLMCLFLHLESMFLQVVQYISMPFLFSLSSLQLSPVYAQNRTFVSKDPLFLGLPGLMYWLRDTHPQTSNLG